MDTTTVLLILASVALVSLVSLCGAAVLVMRKDRIRGILPLMVALAAGALLGDTFLHLLPHAVIHEGGLSGTIAWGVLGGLLGFLVIEGVLHWHHHGEDVHEHGPEGVHSLGWMNLMGDFVHNILDGMLIASAWSLNEGAGVATTIAVLLHEIPQEFGDLGVLLHAGFSPRRALLMNLLTGMSALLGAAIVILAPGIMQAETLLSSIAAGGFLYIACADLVPELRTRMKGWQLGKSLAAIAVGLGLMVLVHELVDCGHPHLQTREAAPLSPRGVGDGEMVLFHDDGEVEITLTAPDGETPLTGRVQSLHAYFPDKVLDLTDRVGPLGKTGGSWKAQHTALEGEPVRIILVLERDEGGIVTAVFEHYH